MVIVAVAVASLFEILPTFLIRDNVPTIASVKPYTPLELAGRDIYIREGCYLCHSQMIRPFRWETERFGEYSKPGEFVYDHPFQWGSRRIGPDLAREGGKYPDLWHVRHMQDPRSHHAAVDHAGVSADARRRPRLRLDPEEGGRDGDAGRAVRQCGDRRGTRRRWPTRRRRRSPTRLRSRAGRQDLQNKEIVALISYLQRLGWDATHVSAPAAAPAATSPGAAVAPAASPGKGSTP